MLEKKRCPFCNSDDIHDRVVTAYYGDTARGVAVICFNCWARGPLVLFQKYGRTSKSTAAKQEAVEKWNGIAEKSWTFHVIDTKTGAEADTYNIALNEDWAKRLVYCDIDGWAVTEDGSLLLLDDCCNCVYADTERFKVVWDA